MGFFIGFCIFIVALAIIEAVIKEYQIIQKRELKKQIRKERAIRQQIKAKQAFQDEKHRIILEQIRSGARPDYTIIVKKTVLIVIFIVLAILIPVVIL